MATLHVRALVVVRGTVPSTTLKAAHPSGSARFGAGAGYRQKNTNLFGGGAPTSSFKCFVKSNTIPDEVSAKGAEFEAAPRRARI